MADKNENGRTVLNKGTLVPMSILAGAVVLAWQIATWRGSLDQRLVNLELGLSSLENTINLRMTDHLGRSEFAEWVEDFEVLIGVYNEANPGARPFTIPPMPSGG